MVKRHRWAYKTENNIDFAQHIKKEIPRARIITGDYDNIAGIVFQTFTNRWRTVKRLTHKMVLNATRGYYHGI